MLRRLEDAQVPGNGIGALRYGAIQSPCNSIPEDDYVSTSSHEGGINWMSFGVFDGHAHDVQIETRTQIHLSSGWEKAVALRQYLFPYTAYELEAISLMGDPCDDT